MKALLAALLGVIVTSWGSILVRLAAVPPLGAAFYRMAFATGILTPALFMSRMRPIGPIGPMAAGRIAEGAARAPGAPLPAGRLVPMMILSGACLALHFATWIASLSYTSIASSVVLVSTVPMFSLAMSALFLGELASMSTLASILVAFTGAAVIGSGDYGAGGGRLLGDLLALSGAFFAAAYLLIGRRLRDRTTLIVYLTWVYGSSAGFLLLMAVVAGTPLYPYPAVSMVWLFLMGLGPSVVGHSLLNYAVRHVRAYVVNTAGLVEPLLATWYAYLIFGERPRAHLYLGGALVAAGLVQVVLAERSRLAAMSPAEL